MELSGAKIPDVVGHNGLSASSHSQLNEMVISLVPEIRPPAIIDPGPPADAQQGIQNGFSLRHIEMASLEQLGSRQKRLVLSKESSSHKRPNPPAETGAQHSTACACGAKESRDEDAGIQNDDHTGHDSIYAIIARSLSEDPKPLRHSPSRLFDTPATIDRQDSQSVASGFCFKMVSDPVVPLHPASERLRGIGAAAEKLLDKLSAFRIDLAPEARGRDQPEGAMRLGVERRDPLRQETGSLDQHWTGEAAEVFKDEVKLVRVEAEEVFGLDVGRLSP